jgi:hypothetical protein
MPSPLDVRSAPFFLGDRVRAVGDEAASILARPGAAVSTITTSPRSLGSATGASDGDLAPMRWKLAQLSEAIRLELKR